MEPPPLLGIFSDDNLDDFSELGNVRYNVLLGTPGGMKLERRMEDYLMKAVWISDGEYG
jgi:hypothetical protein